MDWYAPARVQAASPRQTFDPAGAGAVLIGALVACVGLGALIGWAAGSAPIGALAGAVVGIPGGIFFVYRRYRGAFQ
jgi:F0F1-type ATP synthase assembly protein I